MQNLLSIQNALHKWLYILKYYLKVSTGNVWTIIFFQLGGIVNTLGIILVWLISTKSTEIDSLKGVLSYILIGKVYYELINSMMHINISSSINNGTLTKELLFPTNYLSARFAQITGHKLIGIFTTLFSSLIPVLICNLFITRLDFNLNWNLLILICLIPFSYIIRLYISFLIGFISFFNKDKRNVDSQQFTILMLLNYFVGLFVPLYKVTERFSFFEFLNYLPTSFLLHHPIQIYLGKYSFDRIGLVFGGSILWCLIVWLIGRLIFQKGLKLYEATGL
jgi:ABC-2 type transport system permease protein